MRKTISVYDEDITGESPFDKKKIEWSIRYTCKRWQEIIF